MGEVEKEFSIVQGLSLICYARAELAKSRDFSERLVELAKSHEGPGADLAASRSLGYALASLGRFEEACVCFDRVTSNYDIAIHNSFASRLGGANFGVGSYGINAFALFALGFPDQARNSTRRGLELAEKINHPFSMTFACLAASVVHLLRGEAEAARHRAKAGSELSVEKGIVQYIYWNNLPLFGAKSDLGDGKQADNIAAMAETIDACRKIGSTLFGPHWKSLLARAYGQNGQADEGLVTIAEALDEVARTEERMWEAELYRIQGDLKLLAETTSGAEAETCFFKAIKVARAQNARGWELRAATSLARLWQQQDKWAEAHELLSGIYGWFTEGFDTADLLAAKQLLRELSGEAPQPATAAA